MNIKKYFNKTVVITSIVSLILAFIFGKIFNPFLEFLYSKFLQLGSFFIISFSDYIYKNASYGFSEKSSTLTMYLVLMILSVFVICIYFYIKQAMKNQLEELLETKTANEDSIKFCIDIMNGITEAPSPKTKRPISEILNDCNSLKDKIDDMIKEHEANKKHQLNLLKLCTFIMIMFSLYMYAEQIFTNSVISKTTSNIEIVAPYITDIEYKQLKSKFHSMENKSDYDQLMHNLTEIADKNSLKLKE